MFKHPSIQSKTEAKKENKANQSSDETTSKTHGYLKTQMLNKTKEMLSRTLKIKQKTSKDKIQS